jgi:ABC-type branched-subunit amino acid transport system permease subunit
MRLHAALPAIPALLSLALPLFAGSYQIYLAELILINVVAAIGLNLLTGNCGQISLCHASLIAIGAYGTALFTTRLGVSYALALPAGVVLTTLLGASLSYPARRLSGLYLALVTLGFLEVVSIVIEEFPNFTGGVRGLKLPTPELAGRPLKAASLYYFVLGLTVLAICAGWNIQRSRYGRAFNAVRQSAIVAQALAISPGRTKLIAFSIAAAFAGLAGGLFTAVVGFIDPTEFDISASLRQITFIVVGGLGSVLGSVVGALILTLLPEVLRGANEYSDVAYGAILLATLLLAPKGLVGVAASLFSRLRRKAPLP